ncbi:MAG TPA: ester cyclase [Actinomycetota bacterium]|nr:ester cyclase [Actinomycetota bacterium]
MTPQENAAFVRASYDALNAGDLDTLLTIAAPDIVMHLAELAEPLHGRETWQAGYELMMRAFPDLEAHVEDVIAAEDRVAVRVTFTATHKGEFLGMPATGRSIRYVSHEFYRVRDGVITEEWICSDMASLMHQIG